MDKKKLNKKGIVCAIIVLVIGASVLPSISSYGGDGDDGDSGCPPGCDVYLVKKARKVGDISWNKEGIDANIGDTIQFQINISGKDGECHFSGGYITTVIDKLPSFLSYEVGSASYESYLHYDLGDLQNLTWDFECPGLWVDAGGSIDITFNAIATACGKGVNFANVTCCECCSDDCNPKDDDTIPVNVICEDITVEKFVKLDCDNDLWGDEVWFDECDYQWGSGGPFVWYKLMVDVDGCFNEVVVSDDLPIGVVFDVYQFYGDVPTLIDFEHVGRNLDWTFSCCAGDCEWVFEIWYKVFVSDCGDYVNGVSVFGDGQCFGQDSATFHMGVCWDITVEKFVKPDCDNDLWGDEVWFDECDYQWGSGGPFVWYKLMVDVDGCFNEVVVSDDLPIGVVFDVYQFYGDVPTLIDFEHVGRNLDWTFSCCAGDCEWVFEIWYKVFVSDCGDYVNGVSVFGDGQCFGQDSATFHMGVCWDITVEKFVKPDCDNDLWGDEVWFDECDYQWGSGGPFVWYKLMVDVDGCFNEVVVSDDLPIGVVFDVYQFYGDVPTLIDFEHVGRNLDWTFSCCAGDCEWVFEIWYKVFVSDCGDYVNGVSVFGDGQCFGQDSATFHMGVCWDITVEKFVKPDCDNDLWGDEVWFDECDYQWGSGGPFVWYKLMVDVDGCFNEVVVSDDLPIGVVFDVYQFYGDVPTLIDFEHVGRNLDWTFSCCAGDCEWVFEIWYKVFVSDCGDYVNGVSVFGDGQCFGQDSATFHMGVCWDITVEKFVKPDCDNDLWGDEVWFDECDYQWGSGGPFVWYKLMVDVDGCFNEVVVSDDLPIGVVFDVYQFYGDVPTLIDFEHVGRNLDWTFSCCAGDCEWVFEIWYKVFVSDCGDYVNGVSVFGDGQCFGQDSATFHMGVCWDITVEKFVKPDCDNDLWGDEVWFDECDYQWGSGGPFVWYKLMVDVDGCFNEVVVSDDLPIGVVFDVYQFYGDVPTLIDFEHVGRNLDWTFSCCAGDCEWVFEIWYKVFVSDCGDYVNGVSVFGDGQCFGQDSATFHMGVCWDITVEKFVKPDCDNDLWGDEVWFDECDYQWGSGGPFVWYKLMVDVDGCFNEVVVSDDLPIGVVFDVYQFYGDVPTLIDFEHVGRNLDWTFSCCAGDCEWVFEIWYKVFVSDCGDYVNGVSVFGDGQCFGQDSATFHMGVCCDCPPDTPSTPIGSGSGYTGISYTYQTSTTDPDEDTVKYGWDWNGDGTVDEWTGLYSSGTTVSTAHSWTAAGTYNVKVKAKDSNGEQSNFSPAKIVVIIPANNPPDTPSTPNSPDSGYTGISYTYQTSTTDPDGDTVKYGWDWDGDDVVDEWTDFYSSGTTISGSHSWDTAGTYYVKVKAKDSNGEQSDFSPAKIVVITRANNAPNKPSTPSGQISGKSGKSYEYSSTVTDPDGDQVYYWFDWGDGTNSGGWIGPYVSGEAINEFHIYASEGEYIVKVKAIDDPDGNGRLSDGTESEWSDPLTTSMSKSNRFIDSLLWILEKLMERFPLLDKFFSLPIFGNLIN